MWVTIRVSPSTTRSSSSKRPPRSFLASLASSARILPREQPARGPAAPPAGPDSCPPALSPRPWRNRRASSCCTPGWNGKSIPSCQGEINRVFQPPPELQMVGISSRGCKQGCFQPPHSQPEPTLPQPRSSAIAQAQRHVAPSPHDSRPVEELQDACALHRAGGSRSRRSGQVLPGKWGLGCQKRKSLN